MLDDDKVGDTKDIKFPELLKFNCVNVQLLEFTQDVPLYCNIWLFDGLDIFVSVHCPME